MVVAGQAKSHCIAWTIDDLLEDESVRERLAERTYLLEDCTSPVVVPGVVDYTDEADAAFERYAAAGMHVVQSTTPIGAMADLSRLLLTPEEAAEMDAPGTKDAAVLVPLYRDPLTAVFTERRADLRRHAGEISFPGGRQDEPEEDLRATALREAQEEIGLDPARRRARGRAAAGRHLRDRLPDLPVRRDRSSRARPGDPRPPRSPRSSSSRSPTSFAGHEMQRLLRKGVPIKTPTYTVDGHLVWGATARIVQSLLERLRAAALDVLLDRHGDHVAPLGPGAVVVLHVVLAEQLVQHEPGVRRALADAAVGDDRVAVHARPCRCRARAARRPT